MRNTNSVIKCSRCGRPYPEDGGWSVTLRQGIPVSYLCPEDQTVKENTEAAVNETTYDLWVGRVIEPTDSNYELYMAQLLRVIDDVWRDWMLESVESGEPAALDPYELADETLRRTEIIVGDVLGAGYLGNAVRDSLASNFRLQGELAVYMQH